MQEETAGASAEEFCRFVQQRARHWVQEGYTHLQALARAFGEALAHFNINLE